MFNKEAEFEKEAEDNKPPYAFCTLDTKCELWKDGFQKGAEFGYNKCKEELNQQGLALQSDMDKTIEQNIALKKENAVLKKKNSDEECLKRLAKKGYIKFCSKANEWHKQDIDDIYDLISKDWDIRYFICIMKDKSRVTAIGNCDEGCNGEVSVNLFFEHDDEKYYIDDIVWWKEIVLPKENGINEEVV